VTRPLVRPLAPTPVRPNHLTTARLVTGVLAAACFGMDRFSWDVVGALVFVLSMLLDRADGELARLQNSGSRFGFLYDIITDAFCNAAILLGLGVAAMNGKLGTWALLMSIIAGVCISAILSMVMLTEMRHGGDSTRFESFAGFDPDDAMLLIPVAVLFGLGDTLVVLAAVLTPLAAVLIYLDLKKRVSSNQC